MNPSQEPKKSGGTPKAVISEAQKAEKKPPKKKEEISPEEQSAEYLAMVAKRKKKKRVSRICNTIIICASVLLAVSAFMIIRAQMDYREIDEVNEELREEFEPVKKPYTPKEPTAPTSDEPSEAASSAEASGESSEHTPVIPPEHPSDDHGEETSDVTSEPAKEPDKKQEQPVVANESVVRLQKKYKDVVGWLMIDDTNISNPYVKSKDNKDYVRTGLNGKHLTAGTLFLDMDSVSDFSSFNSLIYGHNMRNGSMFGDLDYFEKKTYFENHKTGTVFLADKTYHLDIFAFLVIKSTDRNIYNCNIVTAEERQAFLDYVKTNARRYRDIGVSINDTILTLSTCSYEFDNARCVLICRAIPY